ncbi:MAG: sulfotransferase domain-containing protein, partial [Allosphingosinicella sp.]
ATVVAPATAQPPAPAASAASGPTGARHEAWSAPASADRAAAGDEVALGLYERYAYFGESLYAEQLERWLPLFPRENFLFIRAEDLFRDPHAELARTLDFLGLAPFGLSHLTARNVGCYPAIEPALRRRLDARFAEPNRRLAALTGIGWP